MFSEVPEAMLVSAHAASNCKSGRSLRMRNSTNLGTTPARITSSIGGIFSMESSLRKCRVAWSCTSGVPVYRPCTICGRLSSFWATVCAEFVESLCPSNPLGHPPASAASPSTVVDRRFISCSSLCGRR